MKKLWGLLALCLLLAGCTATQPAPATQTSPTGWVDLDIYVVNDLHGRLVDTDTQPGVDELTTFFKQAQQTANLTGGRMVSQWMNDAGFAAMTMGGHEFDWGEAQIRENDRLAEFPFLGINVYSRETNRQVDYCQSSLLLERGGVQIGIIGAIGDCYNSIAPEHTGGVYFKTGSELTELVMAESDKLRKAGADFIIYTIHDGYDQTSTQPMQVSSAELSVYYDTALSNGYVDLVFEADSHYSYILTDEYGVYHLQAGANNAGISHVRVIFDLARGDAYIASAQLLPTSQFTHLEKDPIVENLLAAYGQQIAPATQILGNNGMYRNNYMLSQLVARLYRDAGVERWGAQYDIVLGGGYISCRAPGYLPQGEVSYSQLQALLPFDNRIVLCSIQGRDLISRFLENDHEAYHIQTTPYGERVRGDIDPDGTYYLVTDSYSADYTYNRLMVIDTYDANIFARDLLAAEFAAGKLD